LRLFLPITSKISPARQVFFYIMMSDRVIFRNGVHPALVMAFLKRVENIDTLVSGREAWREDQGDTKKGRWGFARDSRKKVGETMQKHERTWTRAEAAGTRKDDGHS